MAEMMLATAVLSVASYSTLMAQLEAERLALVAIQADSMNVLSAAGNKYVQEQFSKLQSGQAVTHRGVTLAHGTAQGQSFAPTVANLVDMGYLDRPFSAQSSFSNGGNPGNYRIVIERSPAGCELGSVLECDVIGKVYIDRAITTRAGNEPDGTAIATMMKKLGGFGGFSMLPNGALVRFPDGTTMPNPVAGNPAGVVSVKFGYGSSGLSQFVRMNDNRDPNLQNKLTVAKDVKADGFVTDLKVIGSACTTPNAIGTAAAAVVICNSGTWQPVGAQASPGAACSPDGKVATSTVTGEQLICKNGVYIKSKSLMAKNVLVARVLVMDGDVVAKPVCDVGGTPDRSFTLTQVSVDVTTAPPKQSMYVATQDLTDRWSVLIKLRTDTGTEVSANGYSITAVMNLECRY